MEESASQVCTPDYQRGNRVNTDVNGREGLSVQRYEGMSPGTGFPGFSFHTARQYTPLRPPAGKCSLDLEFTLTIKYTHNESLLNRRRNIKAADRWLGRHENGLAAPAKDRFMEGPREAGPK